MIDTLHLTYAAVLLVFLTGAAIIALSAFLLLSTGLLATTAVRFAKRHNGHMWPSRAGRRTKAGEPPLPMEEALRQVAAEKAASPDEGPGNHQGTAVHPRRAPNRHLQRRRRRANGGVKAAA